MSTAAPNVYEIPLDNVPEQFEITLGGTNYLITCKWNDQQDAGWIFDIADDEGNSIVANVPLIVGADCLAGLEYLGLGGQIIVFTDNDPNAVPTLDTLGDTSNVYFVVQASGS